MLQNVDLARLGAWLVETGFGGSNVSLGTERGQDLVIFQTRFRLSGQPKFPIKFGGFDPCISSDSIPLAEPMQVLNQIMEQDEQAMNLPVSERDVDIACWLSAHASEAAMSACGEGHFLVQVSFAIPEPADMPYDDMEWDSNLLRAAILRAVDAENGQALVPGSPFPPKSDPEPEFADDESRFMGL